MAVYFIYQMGIGEPLLKIGRAKDIYQRRDALQTGNPQTLVLVGWIRSDADSALEAELHRRHQARHAAGEWFRLEPSEILDDLKRAGRNGFVARHADAFEIVGHDRDAIPEYLGVWEWADLELEECCPFCGAMLSCPLLSGPSTMRVWIKEGTTNACEKAQAGRDHREAA